MRNFGTWAIVVASVATFCAVLLMSGRDVPRIASFEAALRDPARLFARTPGSSATDSRAAPQGSPAQAGATIASDETPTARGGTAGSPREPAGEYTMATGSMPAGRAKDATDAPRPAAAPLAGPVGAGPSNGDPADRTAAAEAQIAKIGMGLSALSGRGIAVEEVLPGSVAAQLGLQSGDVILAVDGVPIDSLRQFAQIYQRDGVPRQVDGVRAGRPFHIHP